VSVCNAQNVTNSVVISITIATFGVRGDPGMDLIKWLQKMPINSDVKPTLISFKFYAMLYRTQRVNQTRDLIQGITG